MLVFAAAAVLVTVLFAAHAAGLALIVMAGYALWYGYSIWRRPSRPCPVCKGRGRMTGRDPGNDGSRNPFGRCWACHGAQAHTRWGVRLFMPATARRIKAGQHARNY